MKKKFWTAVVLLGLVLGAYGVGSGFVKEGSAYIQDYTVSADGSEITLEIGVGSSAGYIRKITEHQQQGGKLYLDCYAAFGGMNGSVGARTTYTLPLEEETSRIGLYRKANCYEEVLRKDGQGVWQRVK